MNYKAVFADLDRTLLTSDKKITPYTKEVIKKLMERGVDFLPCSGRSLKSLPPDFKQMGIKHSVTSNGVSVDDLQAGKSLSMLYIPSEIPAKVFEFLKDEDVNYECFVEGQGYTPKSYYDNPCMFDKETFRVEYIRTTRIPIEDIKSFILENKEKTGSFDILMHPKDTKRIFAKLQERFGGLVYMTNSEPFLVEISNINCGKHRGIERYCQMNSISPDEVIAFGDGNNDIEMMETAGLAVAVGNATEQCKAVADRIVETNDDEGVAKELARIFGI